MTFLMFSTWVGVSLKTYIFSYFRKWNQANNTYLACSNTRMVKFWNFCSSKFCSVILNTSRQSMHCFKDIFLPLHWKINYKTLKQISFPALTETLMASQINSVTGRKLVGAKADRHQNALLFGTWIEPRACKSCCFVLPSSSWDIPGQNLGLLPKSTEVAAVFWYYISFL